MRSATLQLVATPFYRVWLQLGVVLLLLMLVDAGFSRDWSRIGMLTHEQEDALQQVAIAVGCFHVLCGIAAGTASSMRGERWAPRVAKVLAVGFLALVEVVLLPAGSEES
ncbi:hypothetical protein ABPG75_010585 [Micractinium tetrahymenae]